MRKLLLVLFVAMFAFAGCGGGDDGDDPSSAGSDTKTAGTKTTDAADTDFSGKGSGDFCDLARQYETDFDATSNPQNNADVEKSYTKMAKAVDNLVKEAPSEIKADAQTVNDAFKRLNTVLEKYDYDVSKIPESEAKDIQFDSPEIEAASNRVESYFEKVCKIDSDDDGDTDGVIGDSTTDDSTADTSDTADTTDDTAEDTTETTEG